MHKDRKIVLIFVLALMLILPGSVMPVKPVSGAEQPPQYTLYKNANYGFSIEYPATWYHEDLTATGGNLSPVAYFAPDSQTTNAWLSVNYQKDSTAFQGLSDQKIVNALVSTMKQNCQRYSLQSNGFTCSNAQFKTNTESYRSLPAYEATSTWTKTLSDGSTLNMVSIWVVIPVQNDLYAIVVRLSSQATAVYQSEVSHMLSSFNIYSVPEETVTPKNDYSNFGLQKGESISYKYSMSIQASDMETQQTVTNVMLQSLAKQIGNITLNSIDDVQWIKYTVTNVSSTNILFNEETKVRNLEIFQNQRDMKYLQGMVIPITAKIGDSFDMFSSGAGSMLQGTVNKMTTINLGNTDVPVFELSGSTRNVSQDGTTVTTLNAAAHYDKKTGLMLDAQVDMNVIGAKHLKMHYEIKTIDWSGLKSGVQPSQATAAAIPGWIKNTAKWWSEGQVTDSDFIKAIQYLIQNGIITIPSTQTATSPSHVIPGWIKNTVKWWADGTVSDSDFIKAIQYLVQIGIITVQTGTKIAVTNTLQQPNLIPPPPQQPLQDYPCSKPYDITVTPETQTVKYKEVAVYRIEINWPGCDNKVTLTPVFDEDIEAMYYDQIIQKRVYDLNLQTDNLKDGIHTFKIHAFANGESRYSTNVVFSKSVPLSVKIYSAPPNPNLVWSTPPTVPGSPSTAPPIIQDLTGHWSGTFTMTDTYGGTTCTYHSNFESDLTQNRNAITGTVSYAPASYSQPMAGGGTHVCDFLGLTYHLTGTTSSSSFTIASSDGELHASGSFTSNTIQGTFSACGAEGCDNGSFQGSKR